MDRRLAEDPIKFEINLIPWILLCEAVSLCRRSCTYSESSEQKIRHHEPQTEEHKDLE